MGISNRTAALERKISLLLGEEHKKVQEIDKAERCTLRCLTCVGASQG